MIKKSFIYLFILLLCLCPAASAEVVQAQYKFEGSWLPELDPAEIGPTNFQTLQNLRYGEQHPEGISGYSKINTTALTTYTEIDAGIQLRTEETNQSYVIVHAEDSSGTGRIYTNTTAIPSQGDFGTYIHEDDSGAGLPRFAKSPQGNIIYSNGAESYIYSGDRYRVAKLYLADDADLANPRDYTEAANDSIATAGHKFTVAAASTDYFVVFTNRPAQGFYFDVASANATASTLTCNVYTSSGWTAVSTASDGTADGGAALAQDGYFGFDSTVDDAVRFQFEGLYLYAYRFVLSAGSADIGQVKVDMPWQELVNNWDGEPRSPILFAVGTTGDPDENYTINVQEQSNLSYPNGAVLDGITHSSGGYIIVMFEERMSAIRLTFLGDYLNAAASTTDTYYWDGDSWVDTSDTDGTSGFTESGLITWTPPAFSSEFKYTYMNTTGYAYKIDVADADVTDADANNDEVIVDYCTGVPAPEEVGPFTFTVQHKGRVFGVGLEEEEVYNRVDYTPVSLPDVWNGVESSNNGIQSLYFGGADKLTGGASLYNRYGSNIFSVLVLFKNSEMYQLKGEGPEEYDIDLVSENIGCPAPLTIANAEIGFEVQEAAKRNIIMWISTSGPMAYDGAVLYPINGIDNYFDPNEDECINWDEADIARGWYDPIYREYNLLFPSGSGQTTINKWLVFDLERKSWYEKDTGSEEMPISGFQVTDTDGAQYVYGGLDNGYMMRLDNGTSWDGTGITYKLVVGDFWPNQNNIWHQTRIRRIKLVAKKLTTDHTVEILYQKDTDAEEGVGAVWADADVTWTDADAEWASAALLTMSLYSDGGARLVRDTEPKNLLGWAHAVGFQMTTSTTAKAFEPIGWGIEFEVVRDDH